MCFYNSRDDKLYQTNTLCVCITDLPSHPSSHLLPFSLDFFLGFDLRSPLESSQKPPSRSNSDLDPSSQRPHANRAATTHHLDHSFNLPPPDSLGLVPKPNPRSCPPTSTIPPPLSHHLPPLSSHASHQASDTQSQSHSHSQSQSRHPVDPTAVYQYGLNPHAFSLPSHSLQFIMPGFAQGGPAQPHSNGPAFSESPVLRYPAHFAPSPSNTSTACDMHDFTPSALQRGQFAQPSRRSSHTPMLDPTRPVYSLYGHSVKSVKPDSTSFPSHLSTPTSDDRKSWLGTPFDPTRLGIQLPVNSNYENIYSSSGFDLMRALANVVNRPNPQIDVGPVDTSTALVVVDARKPDLPIIFASASFSTLTGYENCEIVGQNCRFLQSPRSSGPVLKGGKRKHSDQTAVYHMKAHILAGKESQSSIINYRKDGRPFVNLVTVIPITWGSNEIAYYVGFQVDLVQQPSWFHFFNSSCSQPSLPLISPSCLLLPLPTSRFLSPLRIVF